MWDNKKAKGYKDQVPWLGAKKHPTGYMRKIGMATSIEAEFWALRDGLILASQMGINNIVVELDAKVVIDLVCASDTPNRYYTPLLNDYWTLLTQFQGMRIKHVYREGNKCLLGKAVA